MPRANDAISSLSLGLLNVLINKVLLFRWGYYLYNYAYEHWRITDTFTDTSSALNFWLAFIIYDLMYYLKHRSSHWYSWLWADHATHHSSEEFNLSTALRQSAFGFLTPQVLFSFAGLAFLFPPEIAAVVGPLNLIYQFWIHTQLIPPFPRAVEHILNTPGLHRIHHVRNPELFSKNYGAVLAVWDWIGGTLELEDSTNEARGQKFEYGIVPVIDSWNPIWANVHHIHHMIFVQSKWHGWLAPFVHWTPPGGKCPPLGSRLNPYEKFDKQPQARAAQAYVYMQFMLVLLVSAHLLLSPPSSEWLQEHFLLSREVAQSAQWGIIWLLVAASLCSVASIQSANTQKVLRRALMANVCLHGIFLTGAVVVGAVLPAAVPVVGPAAMVYAMVHGAWLARIWPRSVNDEGCS